MNNEIEDVFAFAKPRQPLAVRLYVAAVWSIGRLLVRMHLRSDTLTRLDGLGDHLPFGSRVGYTSDLAYRLAIKEGADEASARAFADLRAKKVYKGSGHAR